MMERDQEKRPNYREIVKTLSSYLKGSSAKKRKTMSQSIRRSTTLDMEKLNASIAEKAGIQKKKPTLMIINIILLMLIAGVAVFGWTTGRIQSFLGMNTSSNATEKENEAPIDYLPSASEAFSQGDPKAAAEIAREALEDVNADLEKRKQAAVMLSISDYLNLNRHAKDNCSFIIERLTAAEVNDADPNLAIIRFLEKPSISSEALNAKLTENKYLRLVGLLAAFLRDVYTNKSPNQLSESYAAYCAASSSMKNSDFWGNAWEERIPLWKDAAIKGRGNKKELEPLFASKVKKNITSRKPKNAAKPKPKPNQKPQKTVAKSAPPKGANIKISSLSPSWFAANRKFAGKRPKPQNYEISVGELNKYLKSLPGNLRTPEQRRSEMVFSVKEHLCGLMRRIPFKGDSITLKNGKVLKGQIMANSRGLQVKTSEGKRMRLTWKDISLEQFVKFMLFYIKTRRDAISTGAVSRSEMKEVGDDYLKLATLCDWYGNYRQATDYAKEAVKYNPETEKKLREYLLN
jgi:hypothetical protein